MANYRQIHTQIWKDSWFFELDAREKLLFMYLFSNDCTSLSGMYKLPKAIIAFETGLSAQFIDKALEKFAIAKKVFYADGVVWVVNMQKYHGYKSPKVASRVESDLQEIPDCAIKRAYMTHANTGGFPADESITVTSTDICGDDAKPNEVVYPAEQEKLVGDYLLRRSESVEDNKAVGAVFEAYEAEIGEITPAIAEELKFALTVYPVEWFEKAFFEATTNNKRNLKYVMAILARWKRDGPGTDTRVKSQTVQYTNKKQSEVNKLDVFRDLNRKNKTKQ